MRFQFRRVSDSDSDSDSVSVFVIHTGMGGSLRFPFRRHCEPALIVLMRKVIVKCGVEFMITAVKVQRRQSLVFTSDASTSASIRMLVSP